MLCLKKTMFVFLLTVLALPSVFGAVHYYNSFKYENLTDWYCVNKTMTVANGYALIEQEAGTTNGFCYYDSSTVFDSQVGIYLSFDGERAYHFVWFLNDSTPVGLYPQDYSDAVTWWYWHDDYAMPSLSLL